MYTKDREAFIYQMALECGMPLANVYKALRAATTLQQAAEVDCSVNIPDDDRDALKARCDKARRVLWAVCPMGWDVRFAGDPRGYVVKMYRPNENPETAMGVSVPGRGYTLSQMNRLCAIYNGAVAR